MDISIDVSRDSRIEFLEQILHERPGSGHGLGLHLHEPVHDGEFRADGAGEDLVLLGIVLLTPGLGSAVSVDQGEQLAIGVRQSLSVCPYGCVGQCVVSK